MTKVDTEVMKSVAAKHAADPILDWNVYWQTAVGVVDTYSRYLSLKCRFENAHKIWPLIEEEYEGNLCKLELERDEYSNLLDLALDIFELVCINFNVQPITREWLEELGNETKKRKRLGVTCKKLLYARCRPMPLRGIVL